METGPTTTSSTFTKIFPRDKYRPSFPPHGTKHFYGSRRRHYNSYGIGKTHNNDSKSKQQHDNSIFNHSTLVPSSPSTSSSNEKQEMVLSHQRLGVKLDTQWKSLTSECRKWINQLSPVLALYDYDINDIKELVTRCEFDHVKIQAALDDILDQKRGHEQNEWQIFSRRSTVKKTTFSLNKTNPNSRRLSRNDNTHKAAPVIRQSFRHRTNNKGLLISSVLFDTSKRHNTNNNDQGSCQPMLIQSVCQGQDRETNIDNISSRPIDCNKDILTEPSSMSVSKNAAKLLLENKKPQLSLINKKNQQQNIRLREGITSDESPKKSLSSASRKLYPSPFTQNTNFKSITNAKFHSTWEPKNNRFNRTIKTDTEPSISGPSLQPKVKSIKDSDDTSVFIQLNGTGTYQSSPILHDTSPEDVSLKTAIASLNGNSASIDGDRLYSQLLSDQNSQRLVPIIKTAPTLETYTTSTTFAADTPLSSSTTQDNTATPLNEFRHMSRPAELLIEPSPQPPIPSIHRYPSPISNNKCRLDLPLSVTVADDKKRTTSPFNINNTSQAVVIFPPCIVSHAHDVVFPEDVVAEKFLLDQRIHFGTFSPNQVKKSIHFGSSSTTMDFTSTAVNCTTTEDAEGIESQENVNANVINDSGLLIHQFQHVSSISPPFKPRSPVQRNGSYRRTYSKAPLLGLETAVTIGTNSDLGLFASNGYVSATSYNTSLDNNGMHCQDAFIETSALPSAPSILPSPSSEGYHFAVTTTLESNAKNDLCTSFVINSSSSSPEEEETRASSTTPNLHSTKTQQQANVASLIMSHTYDKNSSNNCSTSNDRELDNKRVSTSTQTGISVATHNNDLQMKREMFGVKPLSTNNNLTEYPSQAITRLDERSIDGSNPFLPMSVRGREQTNYSSVKLSNNNYYCRNHDGGSLDACMTNNSASGHRAPTYVNGTAAIYNSLTTNTTAAPMIYSTSQPPSIINGKFMPNNNVAEPSIHSDHQQPPHRIPVLRQHQTVYTGYRQNSSNMNNSNCSALRDDYTEQQHPSNNYCYHQRHSPIRSPQTDFSVCDHPHHPAYQQHHVQHVALRQPNHRQQQQEQEYHNYNASRYDLNSVVVPMSDTENCHSYENHTTSFLDSKTGTPPLPEPPYSLEMDNGYLYERSNSYGRVYCGMDVSSTTVRYSPHVRSNATPATSGINNAVTASTSICDAIQGTSRRSSDGKSPPRSATVMTTGVANSLFGTQHPQHCAGPSYGFYASHSREGLGSVTTGVPSCQSSAQYEPTAGCGTSGQQGTGGSLILLEAPAANTSTRSAVMTGRIEHQNDYHQHQHSQSSASGGYNNHQPHRNYFYNSSRPVTDYNNNLVRQQQNEYQALSQAPFTALDKIYATNTMYHHHHPSSYSTQYSGAATMHQHL